MRAAPHAVIAESGPGHREARGATGLAHSPVGLGKIALDIEDQSLLALRVLLDARLLDHGVQRRVAGLVVLTAGAEAVKGDATLGPELRGQCPDRAERQG